jgi:hypothetical protein
MKITQILNVVLMLVVICGSFMYGSYFEDSNSDTLNFCKEHYRNESFLSTMIGDEPAEVLICNSSQWRTGWAGYCNSTCFDNYQRCLEENATDDQIRFSSQCHWMGADWFILVGTLIFKFFIPIGMLGMLIAIIYTEHRRKK